MEVAVLVLLDLLTQTGVDLGKAVESPVAQGCVQPGVGGADGVFDAGLVFWLVCSSYLKVNVIMISELNHNVVKITAILGLTLSIIQVADNQLVALWR